MSSEHGRVDQPHLRPSRSEGSAQEFHDREFSGPLAVEIRQINSPALVLGSTQPRDLLDNDRARADGWEIARRRSGGGLVILEPGAGLWLDVFLPRSHRRLDNDVNRAFHWLGEAWASAIDSLLATPGGIVRVHRGPLTRGEFGRFLCFAGLGPGEVSVGAAKIVGMSQRRNRDGARFQCLALLRHDSGPALRYVNPAFKAAMAAACAATVAGWPPADGGQPPSIADLSAAALRSIGVALDVDIHRDGR